VDALEDLKYARRFGFYYVELHINSQVVVNMIHDGNSMSITCWSLVY
jgi:hypothetical protein